MKRKNLFATALAAVMAISTMTMAVPAYAEENPGSTTVKLTVEEKNQFTMTIPATTTMNSDGSAKALENGLTVKGTNMQDGKKVTVILSGTKKMAAVGKSTKIPFEVYREEACNNVADAVDFSKAELEKTDSSGTISIGTTKNLYVKPDAAALAAADAGEYEGTITFTAELKDSAPCAPCASDALVVGAEFKLEATILDTKYSLTYKRAGDGFSIVALLVDGRDELTYYGSECPASLEGSNIIVKIGSKLTFKLDTSINRYSFSGDFAGQAAFIGFFVKPLGETEFMDIPVTPVD